MLLIKNKIRAKFQHLTHLSNTPSAQIFTYPVCTHAHPNVSKFDFLCLISEVCVFLSKILLLILKINYTLVSLVCLVNKNNECSINVPSFKKIKKTSLGANTNKM
jgi:hypothetical protein